MLAFQPGERIAGVGVIKDYEEAEYLVLATRSGLVKKTRLSEYDSNRSGGVIAINLREADGEVDELVAGAIVNADDDVILVSRHGMSIRFHADDEQLRPMGRATSGVVGMKFREGDSLLTMQKVVPGADLFLMHDLHDAFQHLEAHRQPGINPRRLLLDHAGTQHLLVADHLGIGRGLFHGR